MSPVAVSYTHLMLCKLLPLYYPTWLMDFINDDKTWFNVNLNYEQLMQLMDMGYLKEIAPSRIAHVLPWITRIRNKEPKGNDTFNSELLLKRDITLKEHIWTIFEYESSIGYQDNCAKEAYKKGVTARDESCLLYTSIHELHQLFVIEIEIKPSFVIIDKIHQPGGVVKWE